MYTIQFTKYSQKDFLKLDGNEKKLVLKGLKRIERYGTDAGEKLKGRLSDCNKLKYKSLGLRIIFRQVENKIEIIEIVAIGKRDKLEVYIEATRRIN